MFFKFLIFLICLFIINNTLWLITPIFCFNEILMNFTEIPSFVKLFLAFVKTDDAVREIASPLTRTTRFPFLIAFPTGLFIAFPTLTILNETNFTCILNLVRELFIEITILLTLFLIPPPPALTILFIFLILLFINLNTGKETSIIAFFALNLTNFTLIPTVPNPF